MRPFRKCCDCKGWLLVGTLSLVLTSATPLLHAQEPPFSFAISITPPQANDWWGVGASSGYTTYAYRIEASTNLIDWQEIARVHGMPFTFYDPLSAKLPRRLYRAWGAPFTSEDDWKNQVGWRDGLMTGGGFELTMGWVKFAIPLSEPYRVYYQDSGKYPFHADFATVRLPPFVGMSRTEFDAVSLWTNNQQVLLGTMLVPGGTRYPWQQGNFEYGIQFVGRDPYPPEKIRE